MTIPVFETTFAVTMTCESCTKTSKGAAVCILESHASHVEKQVRGLVRMVEVTPGMAVVDLSIRGLLLGTYYVTVREAGDISQGPESTGGIWEALKGKQEGWPCRDLFASLDIGNDGVGSVFLTRPVQTWELIGRSTVVANQQDGKVNWHSNVLFSADAGPLQFDKNDPDTLVGVIARSAGVWDMCSCSGETVWQVREERRGRGML
ncbi:superoxide dismutase 1 copper chaperone [Plenodomus tracheiphilus IPT5]|uniref:Superoxide dismutase 1 copper chaperone n=1 Tax=Plenodomus tracheiphilus IPT5 TaxID=1408161 RepID=A0A6A7ANA2_9PLEO|nr:superoxide dismutase 1 copper chaperone [Plenodomus tracheiphilus IPT5]